MNSRKGREGREWNMDGQDLEWTLAKHSKKRKEMP